MSSKAAVKLGLLLLAGLVIRLLFVGNEGFKNDVQSFEAWAIGLATHPLSKFYATTSFVDYPPGYFYVLWIIGHVWSALAPNNLDVLRILVKLPAIVMDLVNGVLLFAIARRYVEERWALGVAALYVLNPAIIFISAAWGQVDSVAGGLALLSVYLLLRSSDALEPNADWQIVPAWIVLAFSLLIKPQAAVLLPLFLAFAFVAPARRMRRLTATATGVIAACAIAIALTLPFHPTANLADAAHWLYGRYQVGKDVYAVNSVNAFNLWSIVHSFWQPDSQTIGFFHQYLWGIVLVGAAIVLAVARYVQGRSQQAFIEAAALVSLAFFLLATRMHERYLFNGLLFTIACVPFARRYLTTTIIFSLTLLVNLFYSLRYLTVVTQSVPGINAADMWPPWTHILSALNVAAFGYLFWVYLEQSAEVETPRVGSGPPSLRSGLRLTAPSRASRSFVPQDDVAISHHDIAPVSFSLRARSWFNPKEGLAAMAWPLDYALAGLFGVISFFLSFVNYWLPPGKVFDEIYFARAAEEYLSHKYIYENTHPPLTKLIITLSTMLFGGDNAHGWRFLDVLFGAIAIVVLYVFAKRLLRSSLFASFAAILFMADGMHFVQSRIATPEGIVVVFALGTLYAFYRYWIASQSTERRYEPNTIGRALISAAAALVAGLVLGALITMPFHQSRAAFVVSALYFAAGFYLLFRLVIVPRLFPAEAEFASYAEGATFFRNKTSVLEAPDGRSIESSRKSKSVALQIREEEASITYARDGSVLYATPKGSATYTPGQVQDDEGEGQEGRHATGWLIAFTVLLGALVASKWYGVMAYGVSIAIIAWVWLQRYWSPKVPKRWGNPFGFRLDVSIAAIVFLSMTVYVMVWIPDFIRQIEIKNISDLVYRQYSMFMYHDTLKATHPYASQFWSWPIDWRPIAYYWQAPPSGRACCVHEIISLPNPFILWVGLLSVPIVAFLAWHERTKGYALLVVAYLLQWLPWARSPRITFIYHFYVDIPIIVLCNAIVLQRIWQWGERSEETRLFTRIGVYGYVGLVVLAFIWFYPVLAGTPLSYADWMNRMWLPHWII